MLLRSLLFAIANYANTAVQGVLFSPVLLLPQRFVWPVARFWVRSTLWLHGTITGIGEDLRGRENIPAGACLVASKHQSAWETLRLIELFHRPTFILKRELLWIPFFGWYLARTGMIGIDRRKGARTLPLMTEAAQRAVAEGRQIIIFPEGTRREPGAEPQYRFGVARLYDALGVPCLPIALNSGLFWPRRQVRHRPGRIALTCLPPIAPGLPAAAFMDRLQAAVETESDRLAAVSAQTTSSRVA